MYCESSARDAGPLGYRVIMVADANVARRDEDHNATLYRTFVDMRPTADILEPHTRIWTIARGGSSLPMGYRSRTGCQQVVRGPRRRAAEPTWGTGMRSPAQAGTLSTVDCCSARPEWFNPPPLPQRHRSDGDTEVTTTEPVGYANREDEQNMAATVCQRATTGNSGTNREEHAGWEERNWEDRGRVQLH